MTRATAPDQRGFALVGVLVAVALLAALATAMAVAQDRQIRRTAAIAGHDRRVQMALAAETVALRLLDRDTRTSKLVDHAGEALFQPRTLPFEGGQAAGRIVDLQGRFNLNDLYDVEKGEPRPTQVDRFGRLLAVLRLDPRLVGPVMDWIDPDGRPSPGRGAEDAAYLRGAQPYRTANHPFVSVEELRLVAGMTAEAVERLRPHVSALPVFTPLNVNTATPEVVMSLWNGIQRRDAEAMVRRARTQPYESPGRFIGELGALGEAGTAPADLAALDGLGVSTMHVALEARIEDGDGVLALTSVLSRERRCCRVIGRSLRVER